MLATATAATINRQRVTLPGVAASSDQGLRRLVRMVIVQAARDALTGDPGALAWLLGDDCADYCQFARVNNQAVKAWAYKQEVKR